MSPTSWVARRELAVEEWVAAGRLLSGMHRCGQWGLGDWIRYGTDRFGERYTQASRITGYDRQTLMNMVYVASRFEISRRRENLSWSHHERLASLPPDEQDRWLDFAGTQHLSVSDLATALRAERAGLAADQPRALEQNADADPTMTCPHCGMPVPLPKADVQHAA